MALDPNDPKFLQFEEAFNVAADRREERLAKERAEKEEKEKKEKKTGFLSFLE